MSDSMKEIEGLFEGVIDSQWDWADFKNEDKSDFKTVDELIAFMGKAARFSKSTKLFGVVAKSNGETVTICFTGNGPCSQAHARFLGNAPEAMRWMLKEIKSLRSKSAKQAERIKELEDFHRGEMDRLRNSLMGQVRRREAAVWREAASNMPECTRPGLCSETNIKQPPEMDDCGNCITRAAWMRKAAALDGGRKDG